MFNFQSFSQRGNIRNLPLEEQRRKYFYYCSDYLYESNRSSSNISSSGGTSGTGDNSSEDVIEVVQPTTFDMRSVLSAAGQSSFDLVNDDEWFLVSEEDYLAVRTEALASQHILQDADLNTETNLSTFAANLHLTFSDQTYDYAAVPAGKRIIGYTYRTNGASGSFSATLRATPTYKTAGNLIGNTLSANYINTNQTFVLLKNPSYVTETKVYINQWNSLGTRRTTTNIILPMAWGSSLSSWNDWTNSQVLMQVIATDLSPI